MKRRNEETKKRRNAPLLACLFAVLSCALFVSAFAFAQDESNNPTTEETESQDAEEQDEQDEEKQDEDEETTDSLDDLLDIESDETGRAHDTAERQREEELERALLEQQIEDNFEQALALMGDSSELLGERFDAGLGTQRVQEEILKKLDDLINSAQQQQSSSSSSSSSSQSQQQQQQPRAQQQNQQGDSQDQQNQQSSQPLQGEATTVQNPPDPPTVSQLLDETRTEWGNLPERERELLMQALQQRTSALYRRLTSDYYKRLAESN